MPDINAKDVMKLRNSTGLPMMACKKALEEAGGDPQKAEDLLRKQLKGKMESRMDRAAGEGRVAIALSSDGRTAAMVELRAETDFTARNESFINAAAKIAELALQSSDEGSVEVTDEMKAPVDNLRITTGENVSIARVIRVTGGGFGTYVHHDGKTAVLIQVTGNVDDQTRRDVCMHVTAAFPRPLGVSADDIPSAMIEKERKFRVEQAMESGKPREIAEKIVEGGMRKFFEEVALLEQPFIKDPSKKVKELLPKGASIVRFFRWQVGEQV